MLIANHWDTISKVLADAVIGIRADASIEFCNPAACNLFKLEWDSATNISVFELFENFLTLLPVTPTCFADLPNLQPSQREIYDSSSELCLQWHVIPVTPNQQQDASVILVAKPIASDDVIADHLKQIINCIPGSVYWKDKDGMYLGCNQFMVETAGLWAIEDIVGKADRELWPLNAPALRANDMHVLMTGQSVSKEEIVQIPDGTEMCFFSVKMPLKNQNGTIIGVIGNSLDITEQKRTERALALAKEEAEQANQSKAAFLQNMEHDLRTPFSGLYGLTQVLLRREIEPENQELLELVSHSAKQLLSTCDAILEFSRKGDCGKDVAHRVFDLSYLLQRVIDIEMPPAYLKHISLTLECDAAVPRRLIGDEHRLFRILVNLTSNAVKFTESGAIIIRVNCLQTSEQDVRLQFAVEDTGSGLAKHRLAQVNALFSGKMSAAIAAENGFGLGLISVKKFIDELDGVLAVKSVSGKGSIFSCELTLACPQQTTRKKAAAELTS